MTPRFPANQNPRQAPRTALSRRSFLSYAGGLAIGGLAAACTGGDSETAGTSSSSTTVRSTSTIPDAPSPSDLEDGMTARTELLQRLYVPMRDGVRIALDVWLPAGAVTAAVPTVLRTTRYGRAYLTGDGAPEADVNAAEAARWADRGYALVIVDARGSGASFGSRESDLGDDEIEDYGEILDWIGRQAWSSGRVGAYGVSYDGNTAELTTRLNNPHLVAIAPQFSDYDPYRQLVYPGGVYLDGPFSQWLFFNDALDGIDGSIERMAEVFGISPEELVPQIPLPSPVDGPDGADLVEEARADHQSNVSQLDLLPNQENFDDGWQEYAIATHRQSLEASNVPILVQAGWHDAGTAAGTLQRFSSIANHQDVWLGPWNHGGDAVIDPRTIATPLDFEDLSPPEQFDRVATFFDRFVRDEDAAPATKTLRFTTLGATGWTETDRWPLPSVADQTWYLGDGTLSDEVPGSPSPLPLPDRPASSGESSRWAMNVSGDDADYSDWGAGADARLAFAGIPLASDHHLLGFPVVAIEVISDAPDGVLHAYLEQVDGDGTVSYLTEGMLRLSHRGSTAAPRTDQPVERSFLAADRTEMEVGVPTPVVFELFPISVVVPAGARLQLSFAGVDADNFSSYGGDAAPLQMVAGPAARLILPINR